MKPIQLQLTNFGPYEDVVVDFSPFYDQSLFLITGKTGSGKTTLFDAMSYALYGTTSGGLRQGKDMRSNFADISAKTRVTFIFDQGDKRYEIIREPEQTVKKLRGEGTREQSASVCLTVFDGDGKEINQLTKQTEVAIFLADLIQLNAQQFSQIVMLPQGEFRRFLLADSDNKEKVLRKLFKTHLYQAAALEIKEQKKSMSKKLATAEQELRLMVDQLQWDETYKEQAQELPTIEEKVTLYHTQEKVYDELNKEYTKEGNKLKKQEAENDKTLDKQQQLLSSFEAFEEIKRQESLLLGKKEQIELKRERVQQIKHVAKIEPTVKRRNEYLKEDARLREGLQSTQFQLKQREEEQALLSQRLDLLSSKDGEMASHQATLYTLRELVPLFEEQQVLLLELENATNEERKVNTELVTLSEQLTRLQETYDIYQKEIKRQPDLLKQQVDLMDDRQHIKEQLDILSQLIRLEIESKQLRIQKGDMKRELANLFLTEKKIEQIIKEQKHNIASAHISRLSLDLIPGEPCSVCGSKEHPAPGHGVVLPLAEVQRLEEQLEEKLAEQEGYTVQKIMYQEQLAILDKGIMGTDEELSQAIMMLEDRLGESLPDVTYDELQRNWQTKASSLEEQLTGIKQELERIKTLESTLEQMAVERDNLADTHKRVESKAQSMLRDKQELTVGLQSISKRLPKEWDTLEAITHQIKHRELTLEHFKHEKEQTTTKYYQCEKQVAEMTRDMSHYEMSLAELVRKQEAVIKEINGFLKEQGLSMVELEILSQAIKGLDELEQEVLEFDRNMYAIQVERDKRQVELGNQVLPDITPLLIKKDTLKEEQEEIANKQTTLRYIMGQNQDILTRYEDKHERLSEEWQAFRELTMLSDVLNGDGDNKLGVERYVLQTYLINILQVANEKLLDLTNGRYQFELKTEQHSSKKNTGLEIDIYDDNVGQRRGVSTLSGGESFIAALSLALALAEVIQAEAGGVRIDAMFVDEGFGSLDEDALEVAIRALESIEGEGRLIGIISHVRELKERIPQQLNVLGGRNGKSEISMQLELQ